MNKSQEYELEALRHAGLPQLPPERDENTPVWIFAIAKIRTMLLGEAFAIVRNTFEETPAVLQYFGEGAIAKFESIHPYKFLDKKYVPTFDKQNTAKKFVAKVYEKPLAEVEKYNKADILKLVYNYCVQRQLKDEELK